eukprot:12256250-Alexandrium_andersonii.AAC.1
MSFSWGYCSDHVPRWCLLSCAQVARAQRCGGCQWRRNAPLSAPVGAAFCSAAGFVPTTSVLGR